MPEVWVNADQWIEQAEDYLRERGRVVVEKARYEALKRRVERLETALEWYADEKNHSTQPVIIGNWIEPIKGDNGQRARTALAEEDGE